MGLAMFSSQTSPIAIDFGTSSLKLLQIGNEKNPFLVARELQIPDEIRGDQDEVCGFLGRELPKLIRSGGFKGKRVVSAIPTGQTHIQHMQVGAAEGVSLEDLVKGQLQIQMGCMPQTIVVRNIEVTDVHRDGVPKREVICFAVSRDTVMRYVDLLKQCKLQPVGMHTETMAMVRAFDHLNRRTDDTTVATLYVDMGWGGTRVAIAHGKDIRFSRYIQVGGRHFDKVVAETLNCDIASARSHRLSQQVPLTPAAQSSTTPLDKLPEGMAVLKSAMAQAVSDSQGKGRSNLMTERRMGAIPPEFKYQVRHDDPPGKICGVDFSELLETVADELSMCLRYHRALFSDRPLDRVIFLGGESRQTWLCQHLIRALRLPAQLGDPLARLASTENVDADGVAVHDPQPGWAVACGLCNAPTDL